VAVAVGVVVVTGVGVEVGLVVLYGVVMEANDNGEFLADCGDFGFREGEGAVCMTGDVAGECCCCCIDMCRGEVAVRGESGPVLYR
jgi:hypothetical protein